MPEKSPETYAWITYAWVMLLASWGGIVGYIRKVKDGLSPRFSLTEMIGEVVTSGFFGLLTFWAAQASGLDQLMTAVLVGISGHAGARTVFIVEKFIQKKTGITIKID
jgi:predicted CDP-diglyceride synthetase/phosphatidate cytidylyltransferase